jgi:hypothetical protein
VLHIEVKGERLSFLPALDQVVFGPHQELAVIGDITLPDILVDVLREHRQAQLEFRMKLGAGKLYDTTLLFADLNDAPLSPNALSAAWSDFAQRIGMPEVTFHALRHTHASQLIDAGVDIVTIASGSVTPSRTSPCASTATCSATTTAKLQRRLTQL